MISLEQIKEISFSSTTRIVMVVIDGLGGLPHPETRKTELEAAKTPNLDRLAKDSICGLTDPISQGITPGSGPAHLALFGYNPLNFNIGRGVLEALGIDFELKGEDIAARGNFCTVDNEGIIIDRRAGRISTKRCTELCQKLVNIKIDAGQFLVLPVSGHRFVIIFRGNRLSA
jgi:2,3-bisphosphoglycerate-independent phosphoglycerate mutase